MKFGKLIEYNMINIFLEKLYAKSSGETIPRLFLKNQNLWINKFNTICFYCMASWGMWKYIETKLQIRCFKLIKIFLKRERSLELVSLPHFLHAFWRKMFITLYFINWSNFIAWLPLFHNILGNICIVTVC